MCYNITAYVNKEVKWGKFAPLVEKAFDLKEIEVYPSIKKGLLDNSESIAFHFGYNSFCDCGTPLGGGKLTKELNEYLQFLKDLKKCSKIKYLAIVKHFYSGYFSEFEYDTEYRVHKVHIDDIDINFLANWEDDVFYKILYYNRNW